MRFILPVFFIFILSASHVYAKSYSSYKIKDDYIFEKIQNKDIDLEIYTLKLLNNYLYLGTNKGLFFFNGKEIKPAQVDKYGTDKDIIGLTKINESELIGLPYWGKLIHLTNNFTLNQIIEPKLNNSRYKIISAYKYNDSLIYLLRTDYFSTGSLLSYDLRSKHLKVIISNYNYKRFFLDFLFSKYPSGINEDLRNSIESILERSTDKNISIIQDKYLRLHYKIYEKTDSVVKLYKDLTNLGINGRILDLVVENDSTIYFTVVGQNKGLYSLKNDKLVCLYNQDDVSSVQIDKNKSLYFSTLHNGLYRLNLNKIDARKYSTYNDITIYNIHFFPSENKMLLADHYANVFELYLDQKLIKKIVSNQSNRNIQTLFLNDNSSYISCNGLIYNLKKTTKLTQQKDGLRATQILAYKNSILNIGTNYIWELSSLNNNSHFEITRSSNYINSALSIESDSILLATDEGLSMYINKNIYRINSKTPLDYERILHLSRDSVNIYYATPSLIYIQNRTSRKFTTFKLVDNSTPVTTIPFKNTIIIVHDKGYIRYNLNGIIQDNFNIPNWTVESKCKGAFIKKNNIILYNSTNLFTLPISEGISIPSSQTLTIREIKYGSESIYFPKNTITTKYSPEGLLQLFYDAFDRNNIIIEAELINSSSGDSKKVISENNSFLFTNIKYGNYKLRLYSNSYMLNELNIDITSAWYHKWWNLLLIAILITLILFYSILIIFNKLHKRKIEHIVYQNYQLQLESQSKLNQLKPHFIFNALIPLQHYIIKADTNNALNYLTKLSTMLRQVITLTRNKENSILDEIKFIELYLETQQIEKSNSFDYTIKTTNHKSELATTYIPSLMIQPLIENSIIHGLSERSDGHIYVTFELDTNNTYLKTTIMDNGPGFDYISAHKDNALNFITERLELLKRTNKFAGLTFKKSENAFIQTINIPITIRRYEN